MERLRHEFGAKRLNQVTELRTFSGDCMLETNDECEHELLQKVEIAFIIWRH